MPCRASVQCARSPAPPPPGAGAPMEPTAWVLRAVGVASRPGSRRPDGAHRQPPGDERPLRRPTARTSGSPPGDGGTADDDPSFLEHAGVSFSGALCRMFPTDGDDAGHRVIQAAPACAALAGTRRSPATSGSEATPAPPTARSVALDVAAGTDHARLARDRFHQACALRDCSHDRLRGVPRAGTLDLSAPFRAIRAQFKRKRR